MICAFYLEIEDLFLKVACVNFFCLRAPVEVFSDLITFL